jgi:beta-N-acetylhexosaminidase
LKSRIRSKVSHLYTHHTYITLIRTIVLISLVVSLVPSSTGRAIGFQQSSDSLERAQALLETLTPEERVGQLFLVTFTGTDTGPESPIFDLIVNHHVGGVVLQAENDNFTAQAQTLADTLHMIRQLQTDEWSASQSLQIDPVSNQEFTPAFIPLFIGLSQNGDGPPYDQIINGLTSLPSQMAIGATWQTDLAQQIGKVLGQELSALGINLLFGPSLDVLETPHPQGTGDLGVRTFGGDPYWVGEMGRAYISGVHEGSENHMAVVAEHFPGHGSSDRLPEEEVATIRKSLEQLKGFELPPFYAVTGDAPTQDATVDALLASHIRYQGFQGNIRETTQPVSLDPQAFDKLMNLPAIAKWRANGGVMVSDNLGSHAFRRFSDPTGQDFKARLIARNAFIAGNDLLFLGNEFIDTTDPDYYTTVLNTLSLFAKKYREDPAFAKRVDESALRILTMKYRIYDNIITLNQILPTQNNIADIGESDQVTFEVAQEAATLISPSQADLADALPEPPSLNDHIVFFTDTRTAKQCSECFPQPMLAVNDLEQAVVHLYGPFAGGQILQRNLETYTYSDLIEFLDQRGQYEEVPKIETDLRGASWIVFAMLNVTTDVPSSVGLARFLAESPDLFRQKKVVVFAFNAPYFLDQTEVSKITAYYGLYSKAPKFVEVAARLLFGEIPAPGNLPVSVPGVGYDLISATAPDPEQVIPLLLDIPEANVQAGTETPEPTPTPMFEVGGLIPIRTGVILDHNGHPVPDDTLVDFTLSGGNETSGVSQIEPTRNGVARTTFLVDRSGTLEISAKSDPATESTVLRYDVPPETIDETATTPTLTPSETPTELPSPTIIVSPTTIVTPVGNDHTHFGDWLLALLVTSALGIAIFWMSSLFGVSEWGLRNAMLVLIGGLLGYTYLALGLPGSENLIQNSGIWGVLLITLLGAGAGWATAWGWQMMQNNGRLS